MVGRVGLERRLNFKELMILIVVPGKTLENPLDCKEIKPVNPKGNQPWIFIERTDAEAKVPILWPPDEKSWLTGKDPDAGKDWGQEEKGVTEDEMVRQHQRLHGYEFERAPGNSKGQGSLTCCSPWSHKELNTTYWPNNTTGQARGPWVFQWACRWNPQIP